MKEVCSGMQIVTCSSACVPSHARVTSDTDAWRKISLSTASWLVAPMLQRRDSTLPRVVLIVGKLPLHS
jgi:hypothetical protein